MKIIGLIGQKRVGKDTVADIIEEHEKGTIYRFALADPIKDIARIMFGFSENQLYSNEKDQIDLNWGIKPRDFFEKFGTDIMQFDIYSYLPALEAKIPMRCFWVHSLLSKIKQIVDPNAIVIITDIRGMHELVTIKNAFPQSKFIKITRPSIYKKSMEKLIDNQVETQNIHITQKEPELIGNEFIDYFIINDGTILDLTEKINNFTKLLACGQLMK
jgi:dephospho-CoA kinase